MATFTEALRRIYSDLVWRRSRVRIQPSIEPQLTSKPIFAIGLYRSGTTLLRYILDSHSSLACPPESAFLTHFDSMLKDNRSLQGFQSLGFDNDHVVDRIRAFTSYFFENYANSKEKPRWVDKSPSYVDHLDFLILLYPAARFPMIFRHPLDQIDSAVKRKTIPRSELAPYEDDLKNTSESSARLAHAKYWLAKTEKMAAFEEKHPDSCYKFTYESLCDQSTDILQSLFAFIGEPWEESVLQFYKKDHDRGNEDGRVSATRGISPSSGNFTSWPEDDIKKCWQIVESQAILFGYHV